MLIQKDFEEKKKKKEKKKVFKIKIYAFFVCLID